MTNLLGGWGELILAFAAFFASHMIPARPAIRATLQKTLGSRAYIISYSALSLIIFGWLIIATGRAPYVELWAFAQWQLWIPNIIMPIAIALGAFGVAASNPFSIAGKQTELFAPDQPGIAGITRHPLIWGLTLWALAHLVPNGNLAHLLLFGLFSGFGLTGMRAIDQRRRREWGEGAWQAKARHTSSFPLIAFLSGRGRLAGFDAPVKRAAIAAASYIALFALHPYLIGLSPLPF